MSTSTSHANTPSDAMYHDAQRDSQAGPHRIHHAYTAHGAPSPVAQPQQPNQSIPINLPSDEQTKIRRAAKACANCRKHKLRCLGGDPCRRCQRAGIVCDFSGRPAPPTVGPSLTPTATTTGTANASASVTNARVTALETSVSQILGHLEALRDGLRPLERLVHGQEGRAEEQLRPTGVSLERAEREESAYRGYLQHGPDGRARFPPPSSTMQGPPSFPPFVPPVDRSRIDQLAMAAAQQLPVPNGPINGQQHGTTFELPPINGIAHPSAHDTHLPGLTAHQRELFHLAPFSGPSPSESIPLSTHSTRSRLSLRDLAPPPTDPEITPSTRLKDAITHRFDPPFRAITFNPRIWENSEVDQQGVGSRRVSPVKMDEGEGLARREDDGRMSAERGGRMSTERATARVTDVVDRRREVINAGMTRDDPISNGILSERMAWALFQQYATHVHPFMPVFEITNLYAFYEWVRAKSSFLFSVILAISARFSYRKKSDSNAQAPPPPQSTSMLEIDAQTFEELADAAESHLARTLLRKQHALTDVQGTLLMAGWGLRSGGGGPDAWILTGHAFRMARRLGLHLDDALYTREQHLWIGEQGQRRVEKYISRRRVWLALSVYDCLFSLGFGRPPSQPKMDAVETSAFVGLSIGRFEQAGGRAATLEPGKDRIISAATGDVCIASQVELLQIARDFRREMDQIREDAESQVAMNRTLGDSLTTAIIAICRGLNQRLDHWEQRWLSKTPLGQFLRPIARKVQLCYEHIRLCVNAVALKPLASRPSSSHGPSQNQGANSSAGAAMQMSQTEEACLSIAINAAVSVIRLHRESVALPEMVFSFATDYVSCTLAHAALFLICAWKQGAKIDRALVHHSLIQAIDAAEFSERSHTKLLTALGRRMRELAAEAGFTDLPPSPAPADDPAPSMAGFDPLSLFMVNAESDLQIPVDMDVVGQMGNWFTGVGEGLEMGFSWH